MSNNHILQARIDELETSIANTRNDFLVRIDELKDELASLREQARETHNESGSYSRTCGKTTESAKKVSVQPTDEIKSVSNVSITYPPSITTTIKPEDIIASQTNAWSTQSSDSIETVKQETENYQEKTESGFINTLLSSAFESIAAYLLSSLSIFSAPFQDLYHRLIKLYYHYQKQGKAPVFLMTVAGLVTLTVGFGYLLQYSFNTLFNDTLKAITGFVIGGGIIGLGILLSMKKTDFKDYAASIIALGVVFNYLTAYFVGPYYGIVGETGGFLLLLGVTLVSFSLAIVFETRVVSTLTLIGGVFMPFIVGDAESAGIVFLAYLFILSIGNLYLSHRIKWPSLSQITFFLSLSVIEFIGFSDAVYPLAAIVLLSGFFYAYIYFWSFDGLQLKENLSKQDLTILVANVFYFVYVILQINANDYLIAGVFIVHAVLLSFVVKALQLIKSIMAPIYLLMIGLLIATAVFVLSSADVTSIVWAIEGLAMLYIGFRYSHKLIRAEAYVIYIIAMAGLLWQAMIAFEMAYIDSSIIWHWINLLSFGVLSFVAYRIIYYFKDEATSAELKAAFVQNEIFTFWGAIALSITIIWNTSSAMAVLAIIPVIWCFYRVFRHQLKFAQFTGYLLTSAFIIQIIYGVLNTQSGIISEQTIFTWLAIIELLTFFWGIDLFYQRYNISGRGNKISLKLHNAFFYTPATIVILGLYNIFNRHIGNQYSFEFSYLWLDFILVGGLIYISFLLINRVEKSDNFSISEKYRYILNESISLLTSVLFLYTIAILFGDWMYNASVIPLLYLLHRGIKEKLPLTEIFAWLHFSFFGIMTLLSYQEVGNLHFSEQSFATMVGWAELLLSAWALQFIYNRLDYREGGYKLSTYVRTGVYLLIPLLFLPRIIRLYDDYLSVALWISFAISWLMYKKLKIKPLLNELTVLFIIAILSTVVMSVSAITGGDELPGLIALSTGIITVSVFHYFEKTLSSRVITDSPYHLLHLISPYFYGFAIAGFSYSVSQQVSIALVMTGLYFLYLIQERKLFNIMRETLNIAYALTWLGLISVPVLIFTQVFSSGMSTSSRFILITVNLISFAGLWYLTHQRLAVLELLKRKYTNQNIQHWVFHCLVISGYTGSLNLIFTEWSVGVSIAMLIHAVIILFLTLLDKYKKLLRLSIALYIITAIKVLFYDMDDFGNLHKVIALMCIGSILMAAAFLFQKLRNRQLS